MEKESKLLIIDDSIMITRRIEHILKAEAIQVYITHDGEHALQAVAQYKPDLILLDVELPDTNGFELFTKIKEIDDCQAHIIFLTSRDDQTAVKRGITLGASDYIKKPFDADELLLRILAQLRTKQKEDELQAMTAHNEQLHNLAFRDPLTGLLNRNYINKTLIDKIEASDQTILIITDVDDFKYVNDYYGHETGDMVLIGIANTLMTITDHAEVIRWGGEEFIMILMNKDKHACTLTAEDICKSIEQLTFHSRNEDFHCTLTQGICYYDKTLSFTDNVERADQALYFGKRHGKNQVVFYDQIKSIKAGQQT